MSGKLRFGLTSAALVMGLLTGCASIMQGEQYVFPAAGEPSATIRVERPLDAQVSILNRNEEGCYVGITSLPYKGDDIEAQVKPGKELVLMYREEFGAEVCQIHVGITPEQGATYTLMTGTWSETKTGVLPMLSREQGYCGIVVVKKLGEQQSVEPNPQMVIDRGITCHRFVKRKR